MGKIFATKKLSPAGVNFNHRRGVLKHRNVKRAATGSNTSERVFCWVCRPYAIAAAVGSLIKRTAFNPANSQLLSGYVRVVHPLGNKPEPGITHIFNRTLQNSSASSFNERNTKGRSGALNVIAA